MAGRIYLPYNRAPKPREQRFNVAQPLATHYGPVSCRDYDCAPYLAGWQLVLSVDGQADHIAYIRQLRDRVIEVDPRLGISHRYIFTEERTDALLITFTFPAGQPCFRASQHVWHVRPPIWMHDRGDIRRTLNDRDFKDLMNEESYKIDRARQRERG